MRRKFALSIALILAVPAAAVAATEPQGIHRGALHHRHLPSRRRIVEVQPMPPVRPVLFSATQRVPHRVYEQEGLTRDPSDCVVYGCIGNN